MGTNAGKLPTNTSIIIPRLVCRDPASEIDFCVRAFEAVELNRRPGPDGSVAHGAVDHRPGDDHGRGRMAKLAESSARG